MVAVLVVTAEPEADHAVQPLAHVPGPVGVPGLVHAEVEPADGVAAGLEQAAALVRLQDHHQFVRAGHEGQLHLVDPAGVLTRREELDLLEERQLLVHAVQVAGLQVGALEPETELAERLQHALLRGQRLDRDRVEVARVDRAGHGHLGAQAQVHAVQVVAEHRGQRGFPGHGQLEGDAAVLAGGQPERPGHHRAEELHPRAALAAVLVPLHPGDQAQRDVRDVGVGVAARQPHLTGEHATRPAVRVGQHCLD